MASVTCLRWILEIVWSEESGFWEKTTDSKLKLCDSPFFIVFYKISHIMSSFTATVQYSVFDNPFVFFLFLFSVHYVGFQEFSLQCSVYSFLSLWPTAANCIFADFAPFWRRLATVEVLLHFLHSAHTLQLPAAASTNSAILAEKPSVSLSDSAALRRTALHGGDWYDVGRVWLAVSGGCCVDHCSSEGKKTRDQQDYSAKRPKPEGLGYIIIWQNSDLKLNLYSMVIIWKTRFWV